MPALFNLLIQVILEFFDKPIGTDNLYQSRELL